MLALRSAVFSFKKLVSPRARSATACGSQPRCNIGATRASSMHAAKRAEPRRLPASPHLLLLLCLVLRFVPLFLPSCTWLPNNVAAASAPTGHHHGHQHNHRRQSGARLLSQHDFEANVLLSPRPWVVVLSNGATPEDHQIIERVERLVIGGMFDGLVDLGLVNATREPRLARRFGFGAGPSNNASSQKKQHGTPQGAGAGGPTAGSVPALPPVVVGFRADARGLGSLNRVSFDKWLSLPQPDSEAAVQLFKRTVGRMLGNYVEVLSDGDVAESFFRLVVGG